MKLDIKAARARCEAATARVTYWESQWRTSANDLEKEMWYDAVVHDLHDTAAGFAAALEALEEAQGKLEAVRIQAAAALEIAANDLEAVYADEQEGWLPSEGEKSPWEMARLAASTILRGTKEGNE